MESGWTVEAYATWFGAIATTLAILVAGYFAKRQIKAASETAAWTAAVASYQRYLEIGIEHPDLASGERDDTERQLQKHSPYVWYFAVLGYAAEQILATCPAQEKKDWEHTIRGQLWRHRAYVAKMGEDEINYYGPELRAILMAIKKRWTEGR